MPDTDYAFDQPLLANTPAQVVSQLYTLEQATGGISACVNVNKTEFACFKQERAIF